MLKSETPEQIGTRILNQVKKRQTSLVTALGLSSAAVGWSSLSHATDGQSDLQTLILPDTYSALDDGTVILQLETGEQLTLTADQYIILDGGLLLVVDELAQNSVAELPVLGSLRTQLLTEVQPVRSPDGSIVEASNKQPLWSGEGPAPRLFEEIDIQRFEITQDQQAGDEDDEGAFLGGAGGALAGIGITTLGIMNTGADDESSGESPVWVSGRWPNSPENQVTTNYRLRATDVESTKLAYSIVGGADAEKFVIVNGVLTFVAAPDFEAPTDATTPNPDNIYEVTLRATDRDGNSTDQSVNVSVTNANDPPVFTSTTTSFSVEENHTTTGYHGTATDIDNDVVTFSLDSTKDASAFTITSDGELSFSPSPDYETPTDGSGFPDNTYEIDVIASDGNGGTATQSVSVTVTNGYEPWAIVWQGFGDEVRGNSGGEIEPLPDLNGDGKPELLFQYENVDTVYLAWSDHAWGFKNESFPSGASNQLALYYIDEASEGIQLTGEGLSQTIGGEIDTSGDVDGDGINDVLITEVGASTNGTNSGVTYLVFGDYLKWSYENAEGTINLDTLFSTTYGVNNDKVAGLVFEGSSSLDRFVNNAFFMDLDGDSHSEIVFRQNSFESIGNNPLTHVVTGKFLEVYSKQLPVSPLEVGIGSDNFYNLYTWDDSGTTEDAGFAINWDNSEGSGDGRSVPDISGDGFDDLLIGEQEDHASPSGHEVFDYYLFTSEFLSGITDKFDFTTPSGLNSQNGAFRFTADIHAVPGYTGPAYTTGMSIDIPHVAEDIDGDGFPEIVFGFQSAAFNGGNGVSTFDGAVVLVWGGFINERLTDGISNNEVLLIEDVMGDPFTTAAMPTWNGGARKAGVVFKGEPGSELGGGGGQFSLDVGDFDGNGQNDLVIGHINSQIHADGTSSPQGGAVHVVWGEYLLGDPEPATMTELRASADTVSIIPDSPFVSSFSSQIFYGGEVEVLDFDGDGFDDIVTRAQNAWSKYYDFAYSGGGHIISGELLDHMRRSNPEELTDTGFIVFEENRTPRLFDSDGDLLIS